MIAIHASPVSRILGEAIVGSFIVVMVIVAVAIVAVVVIEVSELRLRREMVKMECSPASKASKHDIFCTIDQQRIDVHNGVFAAIRFSIFLLLKHCFTLSKRRTCSSRFVTVLTSCKVWRYVVFIP